MKKLARKSAFALAAVITAVGIVSLPTSAQADTGWPSRVVVKQSLDSSR